MGRFQIVFENSCKILKATDILFGTTKVSDFGTYKRIQEEVNQTEMMEYKMSYTEIGSYFWLDQSVMADDSKQVTFLPEVADASFAFSGRAAIEVAIRDALKYRTIKKAYVPSYCCVSMLQSLIDHGIAFDFYNVEMKNGVITYDIDVTKKCDLFLFMRYFCIKSNGLDQMIAALKQKQVVIIEDITHSLFSEKVYFENSDYVVASLRKWFPTPAGGWVGKLTGTLAVKPDKDSDQVVEDKIKGMRMKAQYMNGDLPVKEEFLMINSKFDNDLIHVDRMLKADSTTMKILASTEIEVKKQKTEKMHNPKRWFGEM